MKEIYLKINEINYPHIVYGFFTRIGGYSKNNFSSLNCNTSSKDNIRLVKKNIKIAKKILKISSKKLKTSNQIHSNIIANINDKNFNSIIKADGLITNDHSIALAVLTADCTPIFIFDKNKSFICCLHAGWKGSLSNITINSLNVIKKYNKDLNDIIVIIGPCISKDNFEVDYNFKYQFIENNPDYIKFFQEKNESKDLFNMRGLINYQFKSIGLKNIFNLDLDTYQNNQLFFSHRRSKHDNLLETGRMINIISFK